MCHLFQDFIDQDANQETKTVTIAAIRTSDDGDVQPDMNVEDRYYNRKEICHTDFRSEAWLEGQA